MEIIKDVERFLNEKIEVAIHDVETNVQPPWVEKKIKKVEMCPDRTHLRIYFDTFYFFAIPLNSNISQSELNWSAYDDASGLYYLIRKKRPF
ncbi:hypothetical protein ACFSO7_14225 [Bacillus sp. CGMCC 1.16607]|uniref:hypothetical protein n=1 Tax=Bacillus sp. CGMCC 1.16607 TaxID=3351842 RepID=UPI0036380187